MTDDLRKAETLDHVPRAMLPWRTDAEVLTECGKLLSDVKSWITVDALVKRFARLGQQRASLTVCMTCLGRTQVYRRRHALDDESWTGEPEAVLEREISRVIGHDDERDRLRRELRAIAFLIEKYRDEFDEAVNGLSATTDLATARRARIRRVAGRRR
jgi:hypothetical protein